MWRFVDLTDQQKHDRRDLLDWYGFVAQISVLVPLLWIQLSFSTAWLYRKWTGPAGVQSAPSSPYVKQLRLENRLNVPGLAARWRKLVWWSGDSAQVAGYFLGTKGEVLGAGLWMGWLLLLSFMDTGDDYLHLTKRFGIVAGSQLPFHYLLSIKSPYSPLQILTKRSHESLIAIHQLLGRIITILLYCHAVLYLNFYIQSSLLLAKLTQFYVLCGVFGILAFTAIGTTALRPLRDWSYRVFYITHVVLATALLPALYLHVHHIRPYIWETEIIFTVSELLRWVTTKKYNGTVKPVPGTNIVEITIPQSATTSKRNEFGSWQPGQHAYISLPGRSLRIFRSNPFTVTSIPSIDNQLRFVARVLNGNTTKMAQITDASPQLAIEGPYGLSSHSETLLRYDRVLFVAGGVGATFIVPLYRQLLSDLSPSRGSQRRQKVNFIWVARSMADVDWALPLDEKEKEGFAERLHVHLTRDAETVSSIGASGGVFAIGEDDDEDHALPVIVDEGGIELEEHKNLLTDGGGSDKSGSLKVQAGRPDFVRVVEQIFTQSSTERVAVVVCGPRAMSQGLRREVGRWVKRDREVWFWEEAFAT